MDNVKFLSARLWDGGIISRTETLLLSLRSRVQFPTIWIVSKPPALIFHWVCAVRSELHLRRSCPSATGTTHILLHHRNQWLKAREMSRDEQTCADDGHRWNRTYGRQADRCRWTLLIESQYKYSGIEWVGALRECLNCTLGNREQIHFKNILLKWLSCLVLGCKICNIKPLSWSVFVCECKSTNKPTWFIVPLIRPASKILLTNSALATGHLPFSQSSFCSFLCQWRISVCR